MSAKKISRRKFLKTMSVTSAGLAASALAACAPRATPVPPTATSVPSTPTSVPPTATQVPPTPVPVEPWAAVPSAPKPDRLTLVFATLPYSDPITNAVADQFEKDWGIKVDRNLPPDREIEPTILSMWAAGEPIDTFFMRDFISAKYIDDGLVTPVTNMPGVDEYRKDWTDSALQAMIYKDEIWGLPCYEDIYIGFYYEDKFEQAGLTNPPETYDEWVDQCLKAKKDGVCEYPMLWVAGTGDVQLPFMWYLLTWSMDGTVFDKDFNPTMGPGSAARGALEWWRKTFLEWEISDPQSLELRFTPAAKAFGTGDYIYSSFYRRMDVSLVPEPVGKKAKMHLIPGNHKTITYFRVWAMSSTVIEPEWSWKLLQYYGGKTKAGEYLHPKRWAVELLRATGYKSVMANPEVTEAWSEWMDVDLVLKQWETASHVKTPVPALDAAWFAEWQDTVNVALQECLSGKVTADQACDTMAEKAKALS